MPLLLLLLPRPGCGCSWSSSSSSSSSPPPRRVAATASLFAIWSENSAHPKCAGYLYIRYESRTVRRRVYKPNDPQNLWPRRSTNRNASLTCSRGGATLKASSSRTCATNCLTSSIASSRLVGCRRGWGGSGAAVAGMSGGAAAAGNSSGAAAAGTSSGGGSGAAAAGTSSGGSSGAAAAGTSGGAAAARSSMILITNKITMTIRIIMVIATVIMKMIIII